MPFCWRNSSQQCKHTAYLLKKNPNETTRAKSLDASDGMAALMSHLKRILQHLPSFARQPPRMHAHQCLFVFRSYLSRATLLLSTILFDLIESFLCIFYSRQILWTEQKNAIAAFGCFLPLATMATWLCREVLTINTVLRLCKRRP